MTGRTTQDPEDGGQPRLVVSYGGEVLVADASANPTPPVDPPSARLNELPLGPGTTTIGSAEGNDLRLEGLDDRHAAVVLADGDEYVVVDRSGDQGTRVNGERVGSTLECGHPLRSGDRVEIGPWVLSYVREESAGPLV
jgi:hypothetical protein